MKHLPNLLTLANLAAGCIGLVLAFDRQLEEAALAIWIAAVFDFLDGFSARLLKVSSAIGKELDSLADMVTFGVLPGAILYQLAAEAPGYWRWAAFLPVLFSALRLARFNIDTRQATGFIGMPTPAAAFLVSGLVFAGFAPTGWQWVLVIALALSVLLVSPLPMLALKFSNYSLAANWPRYLLLAVAAGLLLVWGAAGLVPAILFYVLLSAFLLIIKWK